MPGEGSNRGLRHGDVPNVPSSTQQPPEIHQGSGTQHSSIVQGVSSPQTSGKLSFFGGAGKHHIDLNFYCWFWALLPPARAGRWAQVGRQG